MYENISSQYQDVISKCEVSVNKPVLSVKMFQRQRLINTTETRVNRITNGDSDSMTRVQGRRGLENGMGEQGLNGRCRLQRLESGNETENENEDNENNENDEEGEGEEDHKGPLVPFKVPGTTQVTS